MNKLQNSNSILLKTIVSLIDATRNYVAKTINAELTILYWTIGKHINSDTLQNKRTDYGKEVLINLSKELSIRYGSGFSKRNLRNFLLFNKIYRDMQIVHSVSAQLSWTHIQTIITIKEEIKREFYIQMSKHERWSVRTLQDRISSMLFERTAISKKQTI